MLKIRKLMGRAFNLINDREELKFGESDFIQYIK